MYIYDVAKQFIVGNGKEGLTKMQNQNALLNAIWNKYLTCENSLGELRYTIQQCLLDFLCSLKTTVVVDVAKSSVCLKILNAE
jgi:hypothetical protein